MWWRASGGPSLYSARIVAWVARSRPSIDGLAARAARTWSLGCSPSATAPRIAPLERMWRVSWRVSTSVTMGTRAVASQSASVPVAPPVRRLGRQLAHHDRGHARPVRFHVVGVDPVIPDHRRRHHDDLTEVRRIGEDFLVPGEIGREHHFGAGALEIHRCGAREPGAVLE